MVKIAIIGAGLSGLVLAHQLNPHADVTVYEKSRGVGGRMATRYHDNFEFDHGLPYFKIYSQEFMNFLNPWLESGIIKKWPIRHLKQNTIEIQNENYIACPRMNSLCKALAKELSIELNAKIEDTSILREQGFEWIISTAPYAQSKAIFPQIPNLTMDLNPCFILMLGFKNKQSFSWDVASFQDSIIEKICINSHKPDRNHDLSLCIYSNAKWAEEHIEETDDWLKQQLLNELNKHIPALSEVKHSALHRWRYANATALPSGNVWLDEGQKNAACGDWSFGPNLEDAYQSAILLSTKILERIIRTNK